MQDFTVPEKYREDLGRALDKAVEMKSFSDASLAEGLGISRLNAAILIGFMDKYSFLHPSPKNAEKKVRVTADEWEALGRNIDNYKAELIKKETEPPFTLTPCDGITCLYNKSVCVTPEGVTVSDREFSFTLSAADVCLPVFKKAGLFSKGFISFSGASSVAQARGSADSAVFTRRGNARAEALVSSIARDIERRDTKHGSNLFGDKTI